MQNKADVSAAHSTAGRWEAASEPTNPVLKSVGMTSGVGARLIASLPIIFAALMISLAIAGVFAHVSPVLFWDAWEALAFWLRGSPATDWWALHNEHRIVLGRLLFWFDFKWFGGRTWFLFTMNLVFAGVAAVVFSRAAMSVPWSRRGSPARTEAIALSSVMVSLCFLWSQGDNFGQAFQGVFFLGQLLPLLALLCLARAASTGSNPGWFIAATLVGAASAGTLASGLLALPLLVVTSLLLRLPRRRIVVLVAVSAVVALLYLRGYSTPGQHGSLGQALRSDPSVLFQYVLGYLGSPVWFLTGREALGRTLAALAGLAFMLVLLFQAFRLLRARRPDPTSVALLVFALYILIGAALTASGRWNFGIDSAFSSRYTTPALWGWCALTVVYWRDPGRQERRTEFLLPALAIVAATMLLFQVSALKRPHETLWLRNIAVLALELGVRDPAATAAVFPNYDWVHGIAETASVRDASAFGRYPFQGLRGQWNTETIENDDQGRGIQRPGGKPQGQRHDQHARTHPEAQIGQARCQPSDQARGLSARSAEARRSFRRSHQPLRPARCEPAAQDDDRDEGQRAGESKGFSGGSGKGQ